MVNDEKLNLLKMVTNAPAYAISWEIADRKQSYMKRCDTMVKLLCHTSALKGDDNKLLKSSFSKRCCTLCQLASYDNATHMIMQCSAHENTRIGMYKCISKIGQDLDKVCGLAILMGKQIDGWEFEDMLSIWQISCTFIYTMYNKRTKRYRK